MALWTDLIDPATLTGYARESLAVQEAQKGSLARYLPNRQVNGLEARFISGQAGLVEEAEFRAYDAEPSIGRTPGGKRTILELPALGRNIPVSEYAQLKSRNAGDDDIVRDVLNVTDRVVRGVSERIERLRGTVLTTGKATIDQGNFKADDDFGRDPALGTLTAQTLWTAGAGDPLADLTAWVDLYIEKNGVEPGSIVTSTKVLRALAANAAFKLNLVGGASRPATVADVANIVEGAGLPPITVYDRRTATGKILPDDRLLMLPAPVDPNAGLGTELGATFWGQTLSSIEFGLASGEQPGVVVGLYRNEKPPMLVEVISDAIALPVLANANLSLSAKVL